MLLHLFMVTGSFNNMTHTLSRAACTMDSLWVSSVDVAPFRRRMLGFLVRAWAIAIRCSCPPLSWAPLSPTIVLNFWERRKQTRSYRVSEILTALCDHKYLVSRLEVSLSGWLEQGQKKSATTSSGSCWLSLPLKWQFSKFTVFFYYIINTIK